MPRVLITPSPLRRWKGKYADALAEAGLEVCYAPAEIGLDDPGGIIRAVQESGCNAVIAGGELYDREVLAAAPRLRVIARAGVGFDAVDVPAASEHNVAVAITPGANHEAVAEHTLALILAVGRDIVGRDRAVRQGEWPRRPLSPVRSKVLGIAGLGRIGKAVFTRAVAMGMNVLVYEPYPDREFVGRHAVRLVDFDELLAESDYVTLHMPLSPETKGMINRRALNRMKAGAVIVNTARGGLIVEEDLIDAIRSGHLSGAGLDVFATEPPEGSPLLAMANVVLSPHIAGVDALSVEMMAEKAAWVIIELYQGRWPAECVVNSELAPDWKW